MICPCQPAKMGRQAIIIIFFLMGLLYAQESKVPIAAMDLEGRGISAIETQALTDRLRNELFRIGTYDVVERGMMESILTEQNFQLTGCTSNECLVEVGRLLGARLIVGGSVSKVGGTFTVSARLVDVETGKVLAVSDLDMKGELDDLLTTGMARVAAMLSGEEVAATPIETAQPVRQLPQRTQAAPPLMSSERQWQVVLGIPLGETGKAIEITRFMKTWTQIGEYRLTPGITVGLMDRRYEDTDLIYQDRRAYFAATLNGLAQGRKFDSGIFLVFGMGPGTYDENYPDGAAYWNQEGSESVISGGAQLLVPWRQYQLLLEVRYISTPSYESSIFLNAGIQL